MEIMVDTSEFFASHLRQPRGLGMWAFRLEGSGWGCKKETKEIWTTCLSYTKAKAEAIRQAKAGMWAKIVVLP